MTDLDEYIDKLTAEWPPLTKEQIGLVASVLQGGESCTT